MAGTTQDAHVIRFATFEVNLRSGEIRKAGMKLKLGGQPFQVLAILLERPGEIVTREDLQKRLWPDTFVDIDHNLNAAINKIREVLGDSAENPRFVETVPRRGYRFIAEVNGSNAARRKGSLEVAFSKESRGWQDERRESGDADIRRKTDCCWIRGNSRGGNSGMVAGAGQVAASCREPALNVYSSGDWSAGIFLEGIFGAGHRWQSRLFFHSTKWSCITGIFVECGWRDNVVADSISWEALPHFPGRIDAAGSRTDSGGHCASLVVRADGRRRTAPFGESMGWDGAWSPNGQEIAYSKGQDLFIARSDGSGSRKLVTIEGRAYWLRWSPDAKRIRFTLLDAKTSITALWECGADGSNLHRVLSSSGKQWAECCGEWSPDGRYFFFRTLDKNHSEIWQKREKGFEFQTLTPRALTAGPLDFASAVPSKDGHELFTVGTQPGAKLMKYDPRSEHLERYLPEIQGLVASNSRDGQWIAYVEIRGPESVLWRSRVDGSDKLPLTPPMKAITWPKWSPNGKQIAFAAEDTGKPSMVYVVDAAGGSTRAVMPPEHLYADPSWSPDGKSLMVGRMPDYMGEPGARKAIEMVNLETNKITELEGSEGLFSPHWSPDGRYVAASRLDQQKLMLYDFVTRRWTGAGKRGVGQNGLDDSPQWSPDSR